VPGCWPGLHDRCTGRRCSLGCPVISQCCLRPVLPQVTLAWVPASGRLPARDPGRRVAAWVRLFLVKGGRPLQAGPGSSRQPRLIPRPGHPACHLPLAAGTHRTAKESYPCHIVSAGHGVSAYEPDRQAAP
jgi:hypothetical protein